MGKEKKDMIRPMVDLYNLHKGDIEKLGTKKQLHEELEEKVGLEAFREQLKTCIESKGKAFVYIKEKKIVAYYLFVKESHPVHEKMHQYRLIAEDLISKYQSQCSQLQDQVSSTITSDMAFEDVLTLIWGEDQVDLETLSKNPDSILSAIPLALLGYSIGILLWIITGEVFWLCIGLCFATAFGSAGTAIGRAKNGKNKEQQTDQAKATDSETIKEDE